MASGEPYDAVRRIRETAISEKLELAAMIKPLSILALSALLAGCSLIGNRSGYEQPAYAVVEPIDERIEIRRYGPRVAAEAVVEVKNGADGGNAAFRVLFDYITGANRGQESVAMTAPVATEVTGEEIAMTAPVETGVGSIGVYRMRFFLPATYTAETAPQPTDPRVRIVAVPEETVAALRYSGWRDEAETAARKETLLATLAATAWRPTAKPVAYFYDPPWTIPFRRRNEVVVAVAAR